METLFNILASAVHKMFFSGRSNGKLLGKSFIVRKRVYKNRFGIESGECFNMLHCFKWSFYLQHGGSRSISFNNIKEINGLQEVQA